jgi:hypothetical protein
LGAGSLALTSTVEARNAVLFLPQHEASFIGARAAEVDKGTDLLDAVP